MDMSKKTPLEAIKINVDGESYEILLKREDLNVTGSHKIRGIYEQVLAHIDDGRRNFVISSSGNSAIAGAYVVDRLNQTTTQRPINLDIFISPRISSAKLSKLRNYVNPAHTTVHIEAKTISHAHMFATEHGSTLLRGSTDKYATKGYENIAVEIYDEFPYKKYGEIPALFIPVSSGTTTVGIYDGFAKIHIEYREFRIPALHIVQTTRVYTIAESIDPEFDRAVGATKTSIVDSIVDKVAHRKKEVLAAVVATGGRGWVMDDRAVSEVRNMIRQEDLDEIISSGEHLSTSHEGALAIAGFVRAVRTAKNPERLNGSVILMTGGI